uniref:Uncharacterized protein n=2 Tax=Rhodnius prolixus TaxID=13249 RepID=T1HZD0_RHOPR
MLALEMRNKEALERENKRLMARLLNLEAELEKEKLTRKLQIEGSQVVPVRTDEDEKLIAKLKEEASQSTKMAKDMEEQYQKTAEELDLTRAKLESSWLRNTQLEMELKTKGKTGIVKQQSIKRMPSMAQTPGDADGNDETDESDTDTEEGEVEEHEQVSDAVSQEERQYKLL